MPGIDPEKACHKLHIDPIANLMIQKRRHFTPERVAIIKAEIDKLLEVEFIEEVVHSTWLTNVVLVMKKNKGKWRVCVDYTCPKYPYPLPRINLLVDSTSENQLLSFLDAYSGYNQIAMYKPDKEKTMFAIKRAQQDRWDNECEKAFQNLKKYLTSPPLLSKPEAMEDLYIYLAASEVAVSSALIRQELGA
ncbi:hypothetical protein ACFX1Z_022964 [Malus domestica]